MKKICEGVYDDMSDTEYHEQLAKEDHFNSSSQLKTMITDPQKFHEEYNLGKKKATPAALQDAFDVGTLTHTAVLEPSKLKGSYAKWPKDAGNRVGPDWKAFVEKNKGKLIMNHTMLKQANNAKKAVKKSSLCTQLFTDGKAETSFFMTFMGRKVKVRTDWMRPNLIVDLKTMKGNVRDAIAIKNKIKQLHYDLSAAFYVDVVNAAIKEFDLDLPIIEDFIWVFASKDDDGFAVAYSAKEYLPMGRAKYMKAFEEMDKHEANNWSFPEEIISLQPFGYEVSDWIKPETTEVVVEEEEDLDL